MLSARSLLWLAGLLVVAPQALAQGDLSGTYRLQCQEGPFGKRFASRRLETTLTLTRQADGSYRVSRTATYTSDGRRVSMDGRGALDGATLRAVLSTSEGVTHALANMSNEIPLGSRRYRAEYTFGPEQIEGRCEGPDRSGRTRTFFEATVRPDAASARGAPDDAPSRGARPPGATASAAPPAARRRVAVTPRGLALNGERAFLYGGEVQYFRIRDPQDDPAKTQQMWAETLDLMVGAGMNLAGVYVPWDYHELEEGSFRFDGVADLGLLLELCHARGIKVVIKPGPFINAEWPYGTGSYGAIPEWFKQRYPDALARGPDGRPFNFDPLRRRMGRQPSYFAPALLEKTARWFEELAPLLRRYVFDRPTIFAIQLDNETNFFFSDRYEVDYSTHAVAHYQRFLQGRYGRIAALNAAYGASYGAFSEVSPPSRPPAAGAPAEANLIHQDWFDAGHAGIEDYLLALRGMWERLGLREPDVLFVTNDAPISLPLRKTLHWNSEVKNQAGLPLLDTYPRQFPWSGRRPMDFPFMTSYGSKRFRAASDAYRFAGESAQVSGRSYSAEIQGGLLSLPIVNLQLPVPVSTTDHALLQHVGRGSAMVSLYVMREGINRDGSPYFTNAAISRDGSLHPRFEVVRRYGRLIGAHGDELLRSDEVEAAVALLVDSRFDGTTGGVPGNLSNYVLHEPHAAFGLLEDAGFNPAVLDLRDATPEQLQGYKVVFLLNTDVVFADRAQLLHDYVRGGGHLVNMGHLGHYDERWQRGTLTERLLAQGLFAEGTPLDTFVESWLAAGWVTVNMPDGPRGALRVGPFLAQYRVSSEATPLARARGLFGWPGPVVGWTMAKGLGRATHVGTNLGHAYGSAGYYGESGERLVRARELVRALCELSGLGPLVSVDDARGTAWARRVPGDGVFLFVGSRRGQAGTLRVRVHDLAAMGLEAGQRYVLTEALTGDRLDQATGSQLQQGLDLALPAYGTAVVRIRPARPAAAGDPLSVGGEAR